MKPFFNIVLTAALSLFLGQAYAQDSSKAAQEAADQSVQPHEEAMPADINAADTYEISDLANNIGTPAEQSAQTPVEVNNTNEPAAPQTPDLPEQNPTAEPAANNTASDTPEPYDPALSQEQSQQSEDDPYAEYDPSKFPQATAPVQDNASCQSCGRQLSDNAKTAESKADTKSALNAAPCGKKTCACKKGAKNHVCHHHKKTLTRKPAKTDKKENTEKTK